MVGACHFVRRSLGCGGASVCLVRRRRTERAALEDGAEHLLSAEIDNRRRTEHMLRERTELLDTLIQTSPVGIIVHNQYRVVTLANPAFCEIFGYTETGMHRAQAGRVDRPGRGRRSIPRQHPAHRRGRGAARSGEAETKRRLADRCGSASQAAAGRRQVLRRIRAASRTSPSAWRRKRRFAKARKCSARSARLLRWGCSGSTKKAACCTPMRGSWKSTASPWNRPRDPRSARASIPKTPKG